MVALNEILCESTGPGNSTEKNNAEECIFHYIALHIEFRFKKKLTPRKLPSIRKDILLIHH